MTRIRIRTVFPLALGAAAVLGLGCSQIPSDGEILLGEAAAAVVVSEDDGAVAEGSLGAMTDADVATGGAESASADAEIDPAADSAAFDACDFSARRRRILSEYDENGDGRLDLRERAALRADLADRVGAPLGSRLGRLTRRLRHHFMHRVRWAFDVDGDGRLSAEERTALVDALEQRCQVLRARVLERFDANGNGTLDPEEREAARAARRERLDERRAEILARYDANGNGVLDPEEREAMVRDAVQRMRERRAALLAEFDANGNGTLDPEEIAALKAAIRERVALAGEPTA
jgi:Ca2+-binding EF-hand superfamily protein